MSPTRFTVLTLVLLAGPAAAGRRDHGRRQAGRRREGVVEGPPRRDPLLRPGQRPTREGRPTGRERDGQGGQTGADVRRLQGVRGPQTPAAHGGDARRPEVDGERDGGLQAAGEGRPARVRRRGEVSDFVVKPAEGGRTLAAVLRAHRPMSWAQARKLIERRQVRLAGQVCADPVRRVRPGQRVEVLPPPAARAPKPASKLAAKRPSTPAPAGPASVVVYADDQVV